MKNQFNFKCTDAQKKAIQEKAAQYGFASVSAYVKFVSLNASIGVQIEPKEIRDIPMRIKNAESISNIFRLKVGNDISKKEYFMVTALDGGSKIIYTEVVHIGTLNQSLVHPREVFSQAIEKRAAGIIIGHNHPSGTLEASRADIQITNRLKEVSKIMGIELLDHIIFTESGYYSFSEDGIL